MSLIWLGKNNGIRYDAARRLLCRRPSLNGLFSAAYVDVSSLDRSSRSRLQQQAMLITTRYCSAHGSTYQ